MHPAIIPSKLVEYRGTAHATSADHNHEAEKAFRLQGNGQLPWSNIGADPYPHTVWFHFEDKKVFHKIGFSSRSDGYLHVTPKGFEIVGSEDCVYFPDCNSQVLISVQEAGFYLPNEAKVWVIPAEKRAPFLCLGIRVISSKGSNTHTALQNIKIWGERFPYL